MKRGTIGQDDPRENVDVPSDRRLSDLARRVRFSNGELAELGIEARQLEPFFFKPRDTGPVLIEEPGNSPLELRPLIRTKHGIVVAVPANISTAVRALLIDTAFRYDLAAHLQFNFLTAQAELLFQSNFPFIPRGKTQVCDDQVYCEQVFEISKGRFLHVIISADGFAGWPANAFGSVKLTDSSWVEMLEASMRRAKASARENPNFVGGMTLWMPSGWGAGRQFGFTPGDDLNDWDFIVSEPADLATMNACKDGKPSDIWRLRQQQTAVEKQGFEFSNINGLLNLFHWWRTTDHALFPPHQIDASPPLMVNFGSNLLLEARKEANVAFDRMAIQDENGRWHVVARLERDASYRALEHVYASLDDVRSGNLTGVIIDEDRSNWWIKLDADAHPWSHDLYETWQTVLIWAGQIMPSFLDSVNKRKIRRTLAFVIKVESFPGPFDFTSGKPLTDSEIDSTIVLDVDLTKLCVILTLKANWFRGFYRPDNYAERLLGLTLALGASKIFEIEISLECLKSLVLEAVGSTDFRHRHAFDVKLVLEQLAADGLTEPFHAIPTSAGALAKCGAAWHVHAREAGVRVTNKADCLAFLNSFIGDCTRRLLADLKPYNRRQLIVTALQGLHAALAEESHWKRSARALRAIHGVEQDFSMSMGRVMAANGVLRANSILVELATEANPDGGLSIGRMDLEDFQARAIQLFQTADMYPAYATDRIKPEIHFSPTGDILSSHDFHEAALEGTVKRRHAQERARSSRDYVARFEKTKTERALDEKLSAAITAEYGVPPDVFREFTDAVARIARERREGVFMLRRTELVQALRKIEVISEMDFLPLIDRLTLPSRDSFADVPKGYSSRDTDLSKFDRRFSLIARPIVALSSEEDPVLAIGPALIERAIMHNISGALSGALQNQFWKSREMIAYAGAAGSKVGIEFNEAVASALEALGLKASSSVRPWACLNQKKTEELEKLGDIDVLAINSIGTVAWVCEAKDLKLCRTLGEAAQRLSEYRGVITGGKPDKLLRHLRRVQHLRANARLLAKQLKLQGIPTVHGAIIVNAPQPMQQLMHEYVQDSATVMLDDIDSVPWENGWPQSA